MRNWKIGDHVKYRLKSERDGTREGEAIIVDANEQKICIGYKWYFKENVEIFKILKKPKRITKKMDWEL